MSEKKELIKKEKQELELITAQGADFFQNVKNIEQALYNSKTMEFAKDTALDKDAIAQIAAEIFKQAITGAVQLNELANKQKADALALKKAQMEMELSILTAKAQIKLAEAQALKEIVQARSMIRSVSDNAAINRTNGYIAWANVYGSASNTTGLTGAGTLQGQSKSIMDLTLDSLKEIDISKITEFDTELDDWLKMDKDYGCKEAIIHAPKSVILAGEVLEISGISSLGERETKFLLDEAEVANNTKNYLFAPFIAGEYVISFCVLRDKEKDEWVSDSISIKVLENRLLDKKKIELKKF